MNNDRVLNRSNRAAIAGKITTRHLAMLGLFAAPWAGFLALALKPNPRRMWAQRWPTITFVGLYQLALRRCVKIYGLEQIPLSGPSYHIEATIAEAHAAALGVEDTDWETIVSLYAT